MAAISSYPLKTPKSGDLITFSETYDANAANPVIGNPTRSATVGSINALALNGTVNKVALFTTANTVGDSIITQNASKIGIGTASPGYPLEVNGEIAASGDGYLINGYGWATEGSGVLTLGDWDGNNFATRIMDQNSNEVLRVIDGRVGIGTATPLAALDVKETTSDVPGQIIVGGLIASDDKAFGKLCFANTAAANSQPNKILASIEGRKNGSSNRGILTFNASDGSGSNWEKMRIDSYGKVGIGTDDPQRELDVNGGIRVRGPLDLFQGNDNAFAGQDAGNWYNVAASFNTAFGKNAQEVNVSGNSNSAFGFNSLANSISGNNNTAIGTNSMKLSDGGSFNTGVGFNSLSNATIGQGNTAIGYESLQSKTTSNYNTAVGYSSLSNITTGFRNTAVGNDAGKFTSDGTTANSTGRNSIFIGDSAKVSADNQTNQIVIGVGAIGNGDNSATIGDSSVTALHVGGNSAGIVLKSPDGTAYKIAVANGGTITATAI